MKFTVNHPTIGEIVYTESIWTGKKGLIINGKELKKHTKDVFVDPTSAESSKMYYLSGSFMSGVTLTLDGEKVEIVSKPKKLDIAFSIIIFALVLFWGNNPVLCAIFPIVGGAIGGAVSGAMAMINLSMIKKEESIAKKILISLGMLVATVLICFALALLILSALA